MEQQQQRARRLMRVGVYMMVGGVAVCLVGVGLLALVAMFA